MPLYRPRGSKNWWVRISVAGHKTRRTTGTEDRQQAEEFEQRERERLWRLHKLGNRGSVRWADATKRWLEETTKRSRDMDEMILAWLEPHLKDEALEAIDRDALDELRKMMADEKMKPATVNRYMALVRAILRKAADEWRMLDHPPKVPMHRTVLKEPRWLTQEEFERLAKQLPPHLSLAARFAVLTGLRMRSMLALTWDRIDLRQKRLWVPGEQMKAGRSHGLPLSIAACKVLRQLKTLSPTGEHVFQYEGTPIADCNTAAFKKAVKRAKVDPLRWHDLRHTFASWAVQGGVTLQELMALGGWSSYAMVLRYAHLAPDHLAEAAEKVGRKRAQSRKVARPK